MKTTILHPIVISLMLALVPTLAPAANLTWDGNTALTGAQDGPGTWDNTSTNWWNGSADVAFNNTTPDVPTFGAANGVAGTVTLGANINAGNITFSAPGVGYYTIAGGGFTLCLTNRTITDNANATISANIVPVPAANSSLTLANSVANAPSAILTLSGNNSFTNFNLGINAPNTTAAVRIGSSTAFGWGSIGVAGGQGSQTSHRIELVGNGMTITNVISNLGRNNYSAVLVNLGTGNTMSGTQTKTTGGQDLHWASEVANGLTLSGASGAGVALSSSASSPRYFVLRGTGGGTVSGVVSTGSGGLGIVKTGSGTWTLSGGPNTDAVGTIVDQGTLVLDYSTQNNAKWATTGVLTLGGGTLTLNGGSYTQTNASTTIGAGTSAITRSSGTSTLRMNAINRNRGGVVDFGAASIADTTTLNANGILGGYATVAGADWAMNSIGGANGPITAYTGYTDIAASGSTIADGAASNVRLNSAGSGGNITLGAATTTINTLLQNTGTTATIDTSTGILRLGPVGSVLLSPFAAGLAVGTAVNSGTLTAGGADNTAGEIVLINNSLGGLSINSVIADNGTGPVSLTKAGTGSAALTGSNTYSGTNSIVGGTLNVSSDANLGTAPGSALVGSILINGGVLNATATFTLNANRGITLGPTSRYGNGTISVDNGQTLTYSGIIANSDTTGNGPGGSLTKTGGGTLILGGANTYSSGTIINGGTLSISSSGNLGPQPQCYLADHLVMNGGTLEATANLTLGSIRGIMLGPIGGYGVGTFQVDSGVTLELDSRIADNWKGLGALAMTGAGTLYVTSGFNDYSSDTTVTSGTLQVGNSRAIPNGIGKGNVTVNGTLNLNGFNVAVNGLSGSGTVDNTSSTAVTFGVGNNNQTSSFGGTIQNSGGALALSKAGSGTLTLSGPTTYTGSTLVMAGTLALAGSATLGSTTNLAVSAGATLDVSLLPSGTLTLNASQTLSGNGSVLGTINTGNGTLAPGASAGTLTVANLTLGSGSSLNYDLANVTTIGGGVNDYTVVTGTLTVAGPVTLNLNFLNSLPAASGKYTLFSYNTFSGDVSQISVPSGFTINNNTTAKTIELLINHIPANLTWRGDGTSDVWDINTTPNWIQAGSPVTFFNGDTANFDNTGSNSPPIYVAAPVIPAAVNVNASETYDFTGSSISAAGFTKGGSGTWILENDNTYINGGIISAGTLEIGNSGSTGTLTSGNITNNGAIVANQTGDVVLSGSISGSGSVAQIGSGTCALSASNSYAGVTTISSGRLYARNTYALGDTSNGTMVTSGAQLYIDQNVNIAAEALTLNGSGLNSAGDGALRKGGAGVTFFAGPIILTSDTTINVDGNATLNLTNANGITSSAQNNLTLTCDSGGAGTINGPVNLGGGGGMLFKTGAGSWTLAGSNAMSLATITNGTLVLASTNALGTNLNVVLYSTTGGAGLTGTRLTLSGGISIPANRSLTMSSGGAGAIRSALFGTGGSVTNTWAGTVLLTGDSTGLGNVIGFGVDANSTLVISGNISSDSTFLGGKFLVRGGNSTSVGYLLGSVALDPAAGMFQVDDGTTWTLASSANTWLTTIFAGSSTLRLGVNNALPTSTIFQVGNGTGNRLDLAGFSQQIAGFDPTTAAGLTITNTSTSRDSAFTYNSTGSSTYGGTFSDGVRRLNLTVAAGNLTLTNLATLSLTKSTVSIAGGGAVLEMDYVGTNVVAGLVLNGVSQPAGLYNMLNASPYLTGVGNLLVQPGPTSPVTLTHSVSTNTLSLSWPAGQGWNLQGLTNATGINNGSNNWSIVPGAGDGSYSITIVPTNPPVFYRLIYP